MPRQSGDSAIAVPQAALDKLARAREESGLNQGELAERLGMSRTHFALCELGHRQPSADLISRWADEVGLEAEIVPAQVKIRRKKAAVSD